MNFSYLESMTIVSMAEISFGNILIFHFLGNLLIKSKSKKLIYFLFKHIMEIIKFIIIQTIKDSWKLILLINQHFLITII